MAVKAVSTVLRKVFGSHNERMVKRYLRIVDQVSAREDDVLSLSDVDLRARTQDFKERIADGASARDLIPEVFAVAREAMDRNVGIRNIFNPVHDFDASRLPDAVRPLYDETQKLIESTPDREPADDLLGGEHPIPAWQFVDIPTELYHAVRELYPKSKPPFRARPFDVQIIGAVVLYEGRIAEMKTGEGKTIVAPLATYLATLEAQQVHVITVNDYLVQRDRDWTFPFFRGLGLTVGAIHPMHMQPPPEKQKAYDCDVVYGTTAEFGFDYLRDNMKLSVADQVQKHREFAIVDEVDSTLIDEARTPLIISGQAHQNTPRYDLAKGLAIHLVEVQKEWNTADQRVQSCMVDISSLEGDIRNTRDKENVPELKAKFEAAQARLPELEAARDAHTQYYEVELDKKRATLTHEGIEEAQRNAGLGSFYVGDNIDLPHLLEQAIKAQTVYQRDRDYVVSPGEDGSLEVVIVDQNTGRKMVGRQWSDGLHQAVEAKEGVPVKQETQTMATITIQNFFKLYDKLSGMTGTADTEAIEFAEIYSLDVVVIPTNVPIVRDDFNDTVFMSEGDKWEAIVDEIKRFHDVGRPVLVGTTSVEKSDMLSKMLTRKYKIEHEVLNAKHHERESEMIMSAGELGAVMIATNMAGRGTDIRLGKFTRNDLIDHWKRRGLAPRDIDGSMDDDTVVAAVYRHIAPKELGTNKSELEVMSDAEVRLALLRKWAAELTFVGDGKVASMSDARLCEELDHTGAALKHRLHMYNDIEDLGGLHVIGTERHESRRVDNQLRGRCGRQGDNGSSRFFLSLEDDLMKMFAGPTTLRVLSKLGMKEGDAIEHPMLTKSVGRAQRKVEERNFLIRKQILEYDEVMDHQRHDFYSMRQSVLEGRGIKEIIFDQIEDSASDAVYSYLDKKYVANCVAEWVRENLSVPIDPERIKGKDREDLHTLIHRDATDEAAGMIRLTMGEYMSHEVDPEDWDLKSFAAWANSNFNAGVTESELQEASRDEVRTRFEEAATKHILEADLSPLDQYLVREYGPKELCGWAQNKFGGEFEPQAFAKLENIDDAVTAVMDGARDVYARREIVYPIEFAIEMTAANLQTSGPQAIDQFCRWVRARYELEWTPNAMPSTNPAELHKILVGEAEKWDEDRISERAERAIANGATPEALGEWCVKHLGVGLAKDQQERAVDDPKSVAEEKIKEVMRAELTHFERWVLLQIVDQAWKDHLYAIDQLKEAIGLRSFSQRDPRIEFKREGARLFDEMHESIRDKVTDLIFKAKLTPQAPRQAPAQAEAQAQAQAQAQTQATSSGGAPGGAAPRREVPGPAQPATAAVAAAVAGTAQQQRDIEAAERAGAPGGAKKRSQPTRVMPTVGRNEPCPCGSGKKFKQCCGKRG